MGRRLSVDPLFCIWAAGLLLLLNTKWVFWGFLAAVFHELCHILAVILTKGRILGISIHPTGAKIFAAPMEEIQELICAAAGPAGSLMLLHFFPYCPELALLGFIQGIYNLLPIYPLDGGRVLRAVTNYIFPGKGDAATRWTGTLVAGIFALSSAVLEFFPGILLFGKLATDLWKKNSLQRGESRCTI